MHTTRNHWSRVAKQNDAFDDWLLVLMSVRSLREANFALYMDCLTQLAPWFFSLDHTNYARWVPVHIRDMVNLKKAHPGFINGNFDQQSVLIHGP